MPQGVHAVVQGRLEVLRPLLTWRDHPGRDERELPGARVEDVAVVPLGAVIGEEQVRRVGLTVCGTPGERDPSRREPLHVGLQRTRQAIGQRDLPDLAALRQREHHLRRHEADLPTHRHHATSEVDVVHGQGEDLDLSQPAAERDRTVGLEALRQAVNDRVDALHGHGTTGLLLHLREAHRLGPAGVGGHGAVVNYLIQHHDQDGAVPKGGFSACTDSMAWAAGMAFTKLYRETGQRRFLDGALKTANWIRTNAAGTRGAGGCTGGCATTTAPGGAWSQSAGRPPSTTSTPAPLRPGATTWCVIAAQGGPRFRL
ncbi:hypothetical protein [Kitasatospora sp. NPDC086791]|uniref:hypothetical protein n=1 Tax=Kitasatospora sp. NPDC086791 TaxID=3155178 RepID=UPI00342434A8